MDLYLIVLLIVHASAWNYDRQDLWPQKYCQKSISQSPIDIDESRLSRTSASPLHLNRWSRRYNGTIINNGHSLMVELSHNRPLTLSGVGLTGKFNFAQFHFHWGSEHNINNERKALEAHFVTFNNRFSSFEEALQYANGVTVLGVLYDISEKDNENLRPIIDQIDSLKREGDIVRIQNLSPLTLIPRHVSNFYSYSGSLTTPNCKDGVNWIIFKTTDKISRAQVEKFATIRDENGKRLRNNYRALQPLNERTVSEICTI